MNFVQTNDKNYIAILNNKGHYIKYNKKKNKQKFQNK